MASDDLDFSLVYLTTLFLLYVLRGVERSAVGMHVVGGSNCGMFLDTISNFAWRD
jgi:hypothetical protein